MYLRVINPEQKIVPQIKTKSDPKQGSFTQVQIHMSVFFHPFRHLKP